MAAARGRTVALRVLLLGAVLALCSGCSVFHSIFGSSSPGASVSVFTIAVGDCFTAPTDVKAELSDLTRVPCTTAHELEAYAIVSYKTPQGTTTDTYPGDAALETFANGSCAEAYTSYVGVSYLDSSLFFTYLAPSARSWEQADDRSIDCFVTTTGQQLTSSVKGSDR